MKILHCSFGIWTFSQNTIREDVRLGISVRRKRWVISLIITAEHDNYIDEHLNSKITKNYNYELLEI